MPKTHVRVLGGGNTYVVIGLKDNKKVEFLSQLQDSPGAVNGRATPIQGIGDAYPIEIATGYSMGAGTLRLTVWQTWLTDGWVSAFMTTNDKGDMIDNTGLWDAFRGDTNFRHGDNETGYPVDIYEVLTAQRMNTEYISVQKVEKGADGQSARIKSYQGCVITDIQTDESIKNDSMENTVTITMQYTRAIVTYADNLNGLG